MFNPGDRIRLTKEAIQYYKERDNEWWKWRQGNEDSIWVVVSNTNGYLYAYIEEKVIGTCSLTRPGLFYCAEFNFFTLVTPLTEEEKQEQKQRKLLRKISYLYGKCKTTKQWVTS